MTSEVVFDSYSLAQAVRKHRGEKQLGVRAACEQIGIARSTLSRIEHDGTSDVNLCIKLCWWLGVPFDTFVKPKSESAPATNEGVSDKGK